MPPDPKPPRFQDRRTYETWLRTQPREVAVVLATRSALRVLPLVGRDTSRRFPALAAATFRATALAWAAAKYPAHASDLAAAVAAYSTADAIRNVAEAIAAYAATVRAVAAAAAAAVDVVTVYDAAGAVRAARASISAAVTAAQVDTDIWRAVSGDLDAVDEGTSPSDLASRPLWPSGSPSWALDAWIAFEARVRRGHWIVWRDWYVARLDGWVKREEIELVFARTPQELWRKPKQENEWIAAEIKRLSDPVEVEVPPQKPSAVAPVVKNGKIVVPSKPPAVDLDTKTLNASLKALRTTMTSLAAELETASETDQAIDKRMVAYLDDLAARVPLRRPTKTALFSLAHESEMLKTYAAKALAEWPNVPAARFSAVVAAFSKTMRQFPDWRRFEDNAEHPELTPAQRDAAPKLAQEMATALREKDARPHVDESTPAAIEAVANTPLPDWTPSGEDLLAEDLLNGVENVLKLMAEAALSVSNSSGGRLVKDAAGAFAKEARKSIVKEAGRLGKNFGPALTRWATKALKGAGVVGAAHYSGVSAAIAKLVQQYPSIAKWLEPVIRHLQ